MSPLGSGAAAASWTAAGSVDDQARTRTVRWLVGFDARCGRSLAGRCGASGRRDDAFLVPDPRLTSYAPTAANASAATSRTMEILLRDRLGGLRLPLRIGGVESVVIGGGAPNFCEPGRIVQIADPARRVNRFA
jgi:hypothetical protein